MTSDARPSQRTLPRTFHRLRARLRYLYHGESRPAVRFRLAVIGVDLLLIAFFIAAPVLREGAYFLWVDYAVALILALDIAARALAWRSIKDWLRRPIAWIDLFILLTLLAPLWFFNLGFLRALRIWTLFNSDFFWDTVGRRYDETRVEEVTRAASSLVTFIFVMTGFVYTAFARQAEGLNTWVDALYFTVTSLTTTGYGDITLPGSFGKLVSVAIMIGGVSLGVTLAQALFKPFKVRHTCPTCGLLRHDPDAVHCKACGELLNIPNPD